MKKLLTNCCWLVLLAFSACSSSTAPADSIEPNSPIPAQGTATTFDVGQWNLEWFGDPANGPSNDTLQLRNVHDVIAGLDLDMWAVEEVVSKTRFATLLSRLPGYAAVLANDASVQGGAYYSDFNDTEQKVGLIYKTSVVNVQSARVILTDHDSDFAGRPPLEIRLTATVAGKLENLVVIVLHAKAGSADADWQRRQAASDALKAYLDATYATEQVMVLGDFNDDVDSSITSGKASPYANFRDDAARYGFVTKTLSDAHSSSIIGYSEMIDHQLVTNELQAHYQAGSVKLFQPEAYIPKYGSTTSDHYPVLSRYTF